ncbi:hypothetical protein MtrunA17_Chr1g0211671 [Medicago truncatula]|uniref:Uncharacterized protein n=1 Tax=Medicago truncatula TaxID=3880 RepID=A0A396JW99_MEDTR|nr:hypothetical protein MtrunA17_Chr1g0211671 [Medicago truncatula]
MQIVEAIHHKLTFYVTSCIKVALDFVSPEHIGECFRLTEEFRKLPINHRSAADKFEVKKIAVHAMLDVVEKLEKARLKGSIFVLTVALETLYADLHWCTSEYRSLYVPMVLTIRLIQVWADANVNVYIKRRL